MVIFVECVDVPVADDFRCCECIAGCDAVADEALVAEVNGDVNDDADVATIGGGRLLLMLLLVVVCAADKVGGWDVNG